MQIEIIPTNTCPPDLAELSRRSQGFADFASTIQLDVDDGIFAPELSWPYREGQWDEFEEMASEKRRLPYVGTLTYEAHIMAEEPLQVGKLLAHVGCARIIGHIEGFADSNEVQTALEAWKGAGASEVGLAILLDTPLEVLTPVVASCNVVQTMSIAKLGYQGAPFEARVIARIEALHAQYPELVIEVDGGVSEKNIAELVHAGARRFGVGSAITKAPDPKAAYENLISTAESAIQ